MKALLAMVAVTIGALSGCGSSSKSATPPHAVTATPSPTTATSSPAASQAPPQVVIVQPSSEKTVYVPVPVQPVYPAPYSRPGVTLQVVLGISGHPAGPYVPIHIGPDATTSAVTDVYEGQSVIVDCQTQGGPVYGDWGTTTLWDRVITPEQVLGYLSDEWVHAGSNGQVLPSC